MKSLFDDWRFWLAFSKAGLLTMAIGLPIVIIVLIWLGKL